MPFSSYNHFKPVFLFTGLTSRNIVSLQVSRFSPRVTNVLRNKYFFLRVEESSCEKSNARLLKATNCGFVVRFPSNSQLALDLHQANQPIRSLHFLNLTFVARQDRWKTRNIDPKLAMKQCCAAGWGLLYLVFRRVYELKISKAKHKTSASCWCNDGARKENLHFDDPK